MVSSTDVAGDDGGRGGKGARFLASPCHFVQQQQGAPMGLAVAGMTVSMSTTDPAEALSDDPSKKIRKPYTITKSRESWTEQEHDKFLEALQLFDRDWKKIEAFVGSKSVIQIRSHAQKYFLKVQKNGTHEHVPPPRPKRKATHPYPQKASKNAHNVSQPTTPFQTSTRLIEPGNTVRSDSALALRNSSSSGTVATWVHSSIQPVTASHMIKENVGLVIDNTCSSSTGSPPKASQKNEIADQGHNDPSIRALPDFARVYSFIGAVFDPSTSGHLQKLKEMDPIDVETVLLLMRNLSINLGSSYFEDHKRLISSYDLPVGEVKAGSPNNMLETSETVKVPFIA